MVKCACGCGNLVVRQGRRGPSPTYWSAACRKRAERRRRSASAGQPVGVMSVTPVAVVDRPVDEQVQRALLEVQAVGYALLRLGTEARPEFAWRCTTLGEDMLRSLARNFPNMESSY